MYVNTINNKTYVGQAKDFNRRHKTHKNRPHTTAGGFIWMYYNEKR